jgi:hypothetical protein
MTLQAIYQLTSLNLQARIFIVPDLVYARCSQRGIDHGRSHARIEIYFLT